MQDDIEFEIHRTVREYHLASRADILHRLVLAGIYLNAGGIALAELNWQETLFLGGMPRLLLAGLISAFVSGLCYFLYTSNAIRAASDILRGDVRERTVATTRRLLRASLVTLSLSYVFLVAGVLR